jgi:hypothetical protein
MPAKISKEDKLLSRGWTHDGLWWLSPYTSHRYARREALAVEELREWSASDSAILSKEEKGHSMWTIAEERDNALITFDELSKRSHARKVLRDRASDSNLKGKGTD